MQKLREAIDSKNFTSPLQQLQQRTWLLHWSLFVFFNHPKGRDGIVDMFLTPQYIQHHPDFLPMDLALSCHSCCHQQAQKEPNEGVGQDYRARSIRIQGSRHRIVMTLFVRFDFEGAQKKLKECEDVLSNAFFGCHSRGFHGECQTIHL